MGSSASATQDATESREQPNTLRASATLPLKEKFMRTQQFIHPRVATAATDMLANERATSTTLSEGSFGRAALLKMSQLHATPEAATRLMANDQAIALLANTALPGAEYILVMRPDRSSIVLAGAPEAAEQVDQALSPRLVDTEIYHVRVHPAKITIAGINEVRASCVADIDWGMSIQSIESPATPDRPLHVVRRVGHPVASGVIAQRVGAGPTLEGRLTGQLAIPAALSALDQIRAWYLITSAAAEHVGRLVLSTDQVTVNEMPSSRWLINLTCCAEARMAQWLDRTVS